MAIAQWHSGHVPEDEHKTPFLVVHVPGGDYAFFAFATSIRIEEMRQQQETDLCGYKPKLLILSCSSSQSEQEENVPWQSNLKEHLEVQCAKHTRIELGSHKEVIDGIARHTVLLAPVDGGRVGNNRDDEAGDDGNGHEGAKFVNDSVELEYSGEMQHESKSNRCPPRPHS